MGSIKNVDRRTFIKTTTGAVVAAATGAGPFVLDARANTVSPDT